MAPSPIHGKFTLTCWYGLLNMDKFSTSSLVDPCQAYHVCDKLSASLLITILPIDANRFPMASFSFSLSACYASFPDFPSLPLIRYDTTRLDLMQVSFCSKWCQATVRSIVITGDVRNPVNARRWSDELRSGVFQPLKLPPFILLAPLDDASFCSLLNIHNRQTAVCL